MNPVYQIPSNTIFWVGVFCCSFVLSIFFMPLIVQLNKYLNCYDIPNERKIHKTKIATIGGLGILSSLFITYAFLGKYNLSGYFWISLLILSVTGIYDDIYNIKWHKKLMLQFIAAILFITTGFNYTILFHHTIFSFIPSIIQPALIALLIVLYINAFNLIDGMDGLAGGIASINFLVLGILNYHFGNFSMAWLCMALTGAIAGFLVFNFHPAKIFMGDVGSMSLGFLLMMVSFYTFQFHYHLPTIPTDEKIMFLWVIIGILFLPFADATRVFVTRLLKHKAPYLPGKDHIHHILNQAGFTQRDTVLLLYIINLFFILSGIIIYLNKPISFMVNVLFLKM